ncbi:MAG: Rrf2 family transcriptional regulator [Sphingomonas sp. SCN 67-18]|uniref:RrF2 family transcriptional regulator n=1 Tax=uncultured Sphingomonas sp. TaxID=158754 RepID=UPI00086C008E|nr:Rrf2 family transcriptional regulator [Sphingomonas sp. SCN 67-18]ODU21379.1 MAG: Rrf2 family transcriptional regulator [Sphingomonas sp. SCN 67-18]
MLSQRTRYAIRALLHLADHYGEGPIQLTEIATAQNIPSKFLTVILSELGRAGLVDTQRGKDGGYWLARTPDTISYGDVVRLTRGSLALVPCASRLNHKPCEHCVTQESCRLHHVMLQVRDETARVLDTVKFSDPLRAF